MIWEVAKPRIEEKYECIRDTIESLQISSRYQHWEGWDPIPMLIAKLNLDIVPTLG